MKVKEGRDVFFNIRVDRETHRRLLELARRSERTIAGEIRAAVRAAVRAHLEREAGTETASR